MKTKSNRFWLILIGIVLILCLIPIVARVTEVRSRPVKASPEPSSALEVVGPVAIIYLDDQVVDIVDLGAITETYTKEFKGQSGNVNTVEYASGQIRVHDATCPDQICVSQGWMDETSILPIACLPNSLIIQVATTEDLGLDSATQ